MNRNNVFIGLGIFAILVIITLMFGVNTTMIEPGHTGIKINLQGANRGVDSSNIVTGRVFYCPLFEKVVQYPTFNQRVSWTSNTTGGQNEKAANEEISFQTKDKIVITMDMSVNYTLQAAKVPAFYTQFRCDNVEFFTHGFLRDKARSVVSDVACGYTFEEINGSKKAEFEASINKALADIVSPFGVLIDQHGVSIIGNLRPPQEIKDQINKNVIATQKAITAENELREVTAQAAKAVENAKGVAKANELIAKSITPTLLKKQELEIEMVKAQRWKGEVPGTMIGSGANMLYQLK